MSPKDDVGFVGRTIHRLATAWWHPLLVMGLPVPLAVIAGAAFSLPERPAA